MLWGLRRICAAVSAVKETMCLTRAFVSDPLTATAALDRLAHVEAQGHHRRRSACGTSGLRKWHLGWQVQVVALVLVPAQILLDPVQGLTQGQTRLSWPAK